MVFLKIEAWQEDGRAGGYAKFAARIDGELSREIILNLCDKKSFWLFKLLDRQITDDDLHELALGGPVVRDCGDLFVGWGFKITPCTEQDYNSFLAEEQSVLEAQASLEKKRSEEAEARELKKNTLISSALSKLSREEISALGFENWKPK
jgi:hypothetical protein